MLWLVMTILHSRENEKALVWTRVSSVGTFLDSAHRIKKDKKNHKDRARL